MTVAATMGFDYRWVDPDAQHGSNFGSCVDLFAPGWQITSASMSGVNQYAPRTGTSIAAAHVTGVVAMYLEAHPSASPSAVMKALYSLASVNRVLNDGPLPNRLLYSPLQSPCFAPDRMSVDTHLDAARSECLQSEDGRYRFVMQSDGNLVLYGPSGRGLWASNTVGSGARYVNMQGDGNLVIYNGNDRSVWASNTAERYGAVLVVQNDGNVVIYQGAQGIWSTRTAGRTGMRTAGRT